jgi:hypothetical protein
MGVCVAGHRLHGRRRRELRPCGRGIATGSEVIFTQSCEQGRRVKMTLFHSMGSPYKVERPAGKGLYGSWLGRGRPGQLHLRRLHDFGAAAQHGRRRARSYCRFILPLIKFIPYSLTYSVPLFMKRQCDRILGRRLPERRRPGARPLLHAGLRLWIRPQRWRAAGARGMRGFRGLT